MRGGRMQLFNLAGRRASEMDEPDRQPGPTDNGLARLYVAMSVSD